MEACTVGRSTFNKPQGPRIFNTDLSRAYVPPRQAWTGAGASGLNPASHPAELPPKSKSPVPNRRASDNYYEDADPRFTEEPEVTLPHDDRKANVPPLALGSLDDDVHLPGGSRSPSERSGYTSVSQRGVNPNWNHSGYPMPTQHGLSPPPQRANVLNSNPDFEVPGGTRKGRAPGQLTNTGMVPSSAYDGAL